MEDTMECPCNESPDHPGPHVPGCPWTDPPESVTGMRSIPAVSQREAELLVLLHHAMGALRDCAAPGARAGMVLAELDEQLDKLGSR